MGKKLLLLYILILTFGLFSNSLAAQCTDSEPTINITNQSANSLCDGESISFTSSVTPGNPSIAYKYDWQFQKDGGTWTSTPNNGNSNLNFQPATGAYKIRLIITYCDGTTEQQSKTSSSSTTITVYPIKTGSVTISANKNIICPGENIQFTSAPQNHGGSGATYEWRLLNNNSVLSNSASFNSNSIPDGGQVKLFMTSSVPCVQPFESNIITITHKAGTPAILSTISGPTAICPNTQATLSVTDDPTATSYIWTLPNGWTGSSSTNTINITTGAAATSAKTISVKAINDCGQSEVRTLNIMVGPGKPSTPSTITVNAGSDNVICPGENIQLSVNNDLAVSNYTWSLPNGWTGSSTSNTIDVTAGNFGQNGVISVYTTNECLDSDPRTITLNINEPQPSQPGSISGPAIVCPGTDNNYSIANVQYADTYEWYLDNNLISGVNGTNFTLNSSDSGPHKLEVLAKNECGESSRSLINFTIDNGTPDAISISSTPNQNSFCEGSTNVTFSVPSDAKVDSYNWSVPSGWSITSGQNTDQITVTAGTFGQNGNISVTASSNDCGQVSATYAVTVKNPIPAKPGVISGPAEVCSGSSNTFSVPAVQYATSYEWFLPNGNTQVTTNPSINFSTNVSGNANLSVKALNECGKSIVSNDFSFISYSGTPPKPGAISSSLGANLNICPPLNNVTFSISEVPNSNSYQWNLPPGWSIASGAGTNTISVNISANVSLNNGSVSVQAKNTCGLGTVSDSFKINLGNYVQVNLGEDIIVCKPANNNQISIPINANISFNGRGLKIDAIFSPDDPSFNLSVPNKNLTSYSFNYVPTPSHIQNGSFRIRLKTENPNGSCSQQTGINYNDEIVIYFLDRPTASFTSTPSEICYNSSTSLNITGTPNTTVGYSDGSSTKILTLDNSGNGVINTGNLTSSKTYTLQNIQYTNGPGCPVPLNKSLAVTVNPIPGAVISYSGPFCNNDSGSYQPTFSNTVGNYQGGKFSANGIAIDQSTGAISPNGVTAGTYTVTYNFSNPLSCDYDPISTEITINEAIAIATQPEDFRICEGEAITLNVEATGDNLSYQWYKGSGAGTAITGATSSSLSIPNSSKADENTYFVIISGAASCSNLKSDEVEVIIDENIEISALSSNADNNEICENGSITFSVTANSGTETLYYQWYNENGSISGATSATYEITNAVLSNAGNYYVEIRGSEDYTCNAVTSENIALKVNQTPNADISYITPICTSDTELQEVAFSNTVGNYSGGTFSYTVVSGGNILNLDTNSGAINPSASDPGTYKVIYTIPANGGCTAIEEETEIVITNAPTASISFAGDQTTFCNDSAQGSITPQLTGTGNYTGGTFSGIPGIDASTGEINFSNLDKGSYTLIYSIPASDGCSSENVELPIEVFEKISITSEPFPVAVCSANSTQIEVAASGDNLTYQWYKEGTAISGATSAIYNLTSASPSDNGNYYVIVSGENACSEVTSETISVTVDENIIISEQPAASTICVGNPLNLSVSATATGGDVSYQWRKDGENITGATGSTFSIESAQLSDGGNYDVMISGPEGYACDEGYSEVAAVVINEPAVVDAGEDFSICSTTSFIALGNDASASNYSSLLWTSNGTGTLTNETSLTPTYNLGNGETGEITFTLTAQGTDGCSEVASEVTVDIELLPVINSMAYSASEFCVSINSPQSINLDLNNAVINDGAFSFTGEAGKTLSLDANTGAIDPSSSDPGDYTILFSIPASAVCTEVSQTTSITIGDLPEADFSYTSAAICRDTRGENETLQLVSEGLEHQGADNFTGTVGLVIDATTGDINVTQSTAGEHTITRKVDYSAENEDGCEPVTETFVITIYDKPIPDFSYTSAEFCSDESDPSPSPITNGVFGEFTFTPAEDGSELSINSTTGVVDLDASDPGTYTITNTVDLENDACEQVSYDFSLTIYEKKNPTFSYTKTSYCIDERMAQIDNTNFVPGGTFSSATLNTDFLNPTTGEILWTLEDDEITAITHTITYTLPSNGTCEPVSATFDIKIDALPIGGTLAWGNGERIFLTCDIQTKDLDEVISLTGYTGTITAWEYRRASNLTWTTYNHTQNTITNSDFQDILGNNVETTIFRAKISNGACKNNTYSESAILSVIPSDIKPSPVKVDPEILCLGDQISLSSETGYGAEYGQFEGGDFTNAGIKNNGWNFTDPNGNEINYNANADSGTPIHWHKTQPKWKFTTANINSPYTTSEMWWNPRNDGKQNEHFAIAQSTFSSNMDTPPFSLSALDEAILTFDQAYNLTTGASIRVVLLKNGSEYKELFNVVGPASSDAYDHFGYGTPGVNQMSIDLGSYIGESNLRVRFEYRGVRLGDIWAVDNIRVPEGPQDVLLQWFYDEDASDPDNELFQIGQDNQNVVQFEPKKIGWNDFEVKTALLLDSNGDPCETINNSETVRVFVFDEYTTGVTATTGECGSTRIELLATTNGTFQGEISSFPTLDGYTGAWVITGTSDYTLSNEDENLDAVNDPNAIFEAEELGDFTFEWVLTPTAKDENGTLIQNTGCPPTINPSEVSIPACTTLDFDGINDYVDLGTNYQGNYNFECWIRPEASTGTIISGPGFEIKMSDLPDIIVPNDRWYHIAVTGGNVYVDGIASGTIGNAVGGSRTLIGARWNSTTKVPENYFSGWIDELRIWKSALSEKEIRFMMNQRLNLASKGAGNIVEGEIVPNKNIIGSYYTNNGLNLDQDGDYFYNRTWDDLAGYYRLISAEPDPLNLVTFDANLKPANGTTPDLALNTVDGILKNMTTHQQNTSPVPYFSGNNGDWSSRSTWARPDVWDYPNSTYNGTSIDWNIARLNHNITSGNKHIIMLGLVSESAYLTIDDSHSLTISHYLLLNGFIDLVAESQLLQYHGSILDNTSSGWAEVDQQGRMSSFNYNYWSSPFSDRGSNNNAGFMLKNVLFDGTSVNVAGNPEEKNVVFKPGYYSADGGITSPITISDEWIWDFRGGNNDTYQDWLHLGSEFTEIVGAGYSMKGTTGNASLSDKQNYVFRGKPNNGNIPVTDLNVQEGKDFLVGNPYPSAIDAKEFIKDNLIDIGTGSGNGQNPNGENVFNGTLYYWDHFGGYTHILEEYIGGYATYNLSGSAEAISNDSRINATGTKNTGILPGQFIPVAQGFFITAYPVANKTFGGDIIFKNTQRIFQPKNDSSSIFLQQEYRIKGQKAAGEDMRAKLRLKFESPAGYRRQILVTRDENTSTDFDLGYDAPMIENNPEDMYWMVDGKAYVIQGVPDFDIERVLPIAVKTKQGGQFKIKIDSLENWPSEIPIYLKDKIKDTIQEISKSPYVTTAEAGEISDRFELVFFKPEAQIPDLEPELPVIDNLVGISYSHFSRQLKINNFDNLEVDKVMIFDLGGKLLKEYSGMPNENEILLSLPPVQSGIYIVKVFCENASCNKKIIVK